jgi:hypothetical protein
MDGDSDFLNLTVGKTSDLGAPTLAHARLELEPGTVLAGQF